MIPLRPYCAKIAVSAAMPEQNASPTSVRSIFAIVSSNANVVGLSPNRVYSAPAYDHQPRRVALRLSRNQKSSCYKSACVERHGRLSGYCHEWKVWIGQVQTETLDTPFRSLL